MRSRSRNCCSICCKVYKFTITTNFQNGQSWFHEHACDLDDEFYDTYFSGYQNILLGRPGIQTGIHPHINRSQYFVLIKLLITKNNERKYHDEPKEPMLIVYRYLTNIKPSSRLAADEQSRVRLRLTRAAVKAPYTSISIGFPFQIWQILVVSYLQFIQYIFFNNCKN